MKEEIKRIKEICKNLKNIGSIHEWLDYFYERISNKEITPEQELKYNLANILKYGKEVYNFEYSIGENSIIFEFLNFEKAPNKFLLIYNEFESNLQTHIDIYILKNIPA